MLGIRAAEVASVKRLFISAVLIGFALLYFFSGSNALFLDQVGAEQLPWVYIVNAPLVILGGLGYAAWTRRSTTESVLSASTWILAVTVVGLWIWNAATEGTAAPFAAAAWYRFLLVFGLLGLWEIASAEFDVRQSKRLVPIVALGMMLAFMVGGTLVSVVTAVVGTNQLLLVSGVFFVLYAVAFQRAVNAADFSNSDATDPATPAEIVKDSFSRNLAAMRSITILLVFISEFIFYEQVEANFDSDEGVATFLGLFLAGATLAMIVVTVAVTGRYMIRFGIGVGLATMPAGLLLGALVLGVWGAVAGEGTGLFVLAVALNLLSLVLSNAIETPVGAVVYQPMPVERRMPVRVAVDGWLGSVALLGVGLLLLAVRAVGATSVLPFAWLLAAVALVGLWVARRLHGDYLGALTSATTLAFSGSPSARALVDGMAEDQGAIQSGLFGDDPGAALAIARLVHDDDHASTQLVLPDLIDHVDDDVASMAMKAAARSGNADTIPRLELVIGDEARSSALRADALRTLHVLDPDAAVGIAKGLGSLADAALFGRLDAQVAALDLATGSATAIDLPALAIASVDDQKRAASVIAAWPDESPLTSSAQDALALLLASSDDEVVAASLVAARPHFVADLAPTLVLLGVDSVQRRSVVEVLANGGAPAIDAINNSLGELPEDYVADLVDGVYAPNTRRPVLLHQFLSPDASSKVRRAGFDAVRRADIELPATIDRITRDDVEWGRLILATYRDCDPELDTALHLGLQEEFAAGRRTLWAALRAKGSADRVAELEAVASRSVEDDRANAIEALDSFLPLKTRDLVVPMLEPVSLTQALEVATDLPEPLDNMASLERLRSFGRLGLATRHLISHYLAPAKDPHMSEVLERVIALKRIDIFSTLPYSLLAELAESVEEQSFVAEQVIIEKGELGDVLFAITSGEVSIPATGAVMGAGSAFGELAVLDPGPRTATVLARTDVTVLVVKRTMLLALTDRFPEVMTEIARVLATRLRATTV